MVPVSDNKKEALVDYVTLSKNDATSLPLLATPHHFANLLSTLIGRPYGWGNLYFYNDCSAELKNLFTPFGIWLPRHSSDQVTIGKQVDMTPSSPTQRLDYLMENGRRWMTIIYIGGHVILYVGNYPNPHSFNHELMAMTYQDMWGLSPNPPNRRAVVGQSVLFPLLLNYPEDPRLVSQVGKKFFQLSFLDEMPGYLTKWEIIDLRSLMYP
jgi:cell wall-associated NlpC family hydrolase